MSLHDRIAEFSLGKQDSALFLEAAKWIGNEGAHTRGLELDDLLDAFDFIETALHKSYEPGDDVAEKAQKVVAGRRPLSQQP
jgi:hypothetical protein